MQKRFFYDFSSRILIEANNEKEAEKIANGLPYCGFIINEEIYPIDENYVATDLIKREGQIGTIYHPLDDSDKYDKYKIRKCRYHPIFKEFYNSKISKRELISRINEAKEKNCIMDDCDLFVEIDMIDLKSKEYKKVRLVSVD